MQWSQWAFVPAVRIGQYSYRNNSNLKSGSGDHTRGYWLLWRDLSLQLRLTERCFNINMDISFTLSSSSAGLGPGGQTDSPHLNDQASCPPWSCYQWYFWLLPWHSILTGLLIVAMPSFVHDQYKCGKCTKTYNYRWIMLMV